jgi:uncharacterized protein (UPF0218 family)
VPSQFRIEIARTLREEPGCIPLEVLDAVREASEDEAVQVEITEEDLAPVGG